MKIRALTRGDLFAYREIRLESLRLHPEAFGSSFEEESGFSADEFASRIPESPPDALFGAFAADDLLIGTLGVLVSRRPKHRHKANLWGMYVRPAARGHGIGAALLDTAIRHLRALGGIELVQLGVAATNGAARALYGKAGFVVYGTEPRALKLASGAYVDEELRVLDLLSPVPPD